MKRYAGLFWKAGVAASRLPCWSSLGAPQSNCQRCVFPSVVMQTKPCSVQACAGELQKVGFIGVGNMGSHMAANLLRAKYSLCVLDRNKDAMQALAEKGASLATTPLDVAKESDVIITMLPNSEQVQEVFIGGNGILTEGSPIRPSLFIDCSTIDPQTCRSLAAKVAAYPRTYSSDRRIMLDAPVSGGVGGAQAATLTFMVGGPEEGLNAAKPLLSAMGKRIVHCGGPGNGAAAKVCNNLAMGISMSAVSEGYALGQSLGINAKILAKIFNSSTARCWSSDTYNPVPGIMNNVPASRDYKGGFSCTLLTKDLGLAIKAAKETGTTIPLTLKVHEMYTSLCEEGHGHADFSSIFCYKYGGESEAASDIENLEGSPV